MNYTFELPEANFSKSFRGFSVKEVEEFFQNSLEVMNQANEFIAELSGKITSLEKEINRLQEAEMALFKALNSAEDAKEEMKLKLKVEGEKLIEQAKEEAQKIVLSAKEEAEKLKMVASQENQEQKDKLKQDLVEQERELNQLKEAQKLIVKQLSEISKATLERVSTWEGSGELTVESEKLKVESGKLKVESGKLNVERVGSKVSKVGKVSKVVGKGNDGGKVSKKDVKSEKLKVESEGDSGLPTLGKVLEAYAKSNAPKGNIADIS